MENELEYLADRGGHGGHLGEKFVKKYCSLPKLSRLPCRNLAVVTRRQLAISGIISKRSFWTLKRIELEYLLWVASWAIVGMHPPINPIRSRWIRPAPGPLWTHLLEVPLLEQKEFGSRS